MSIIDVEDFDATSLGAARMVRVAVNPGRLETGDIEVQLIHGPVDLEGDLAAGSATRSMEALSVGDDGVVFFEATLRSETAGRQGFVVRVVPAHEELGHFSALNSVTWAK